MRGRNREFAMTKRRHSPDEIAAKLRLAETWNAQGKLHGDIAKALGVSLMTYHRWRKARPGPTDPVAPPRPSQVAPPVPAGEAARIAELRLENSRLRRLVTDLLLEKVQLEEELQDGRGQRRRS
jgi:putative transposase